MSQIKFNVPNRKYVDGKRKMISLRMPEKLMDALDKTARERGWTTTDLVMTVLDQYLQWELKRKG